MSPLLRPGLTSDAVAVRPAAGQGERPTGLPGRERRRVWLWRMGRPQVGQRIAAGSEAEPGDFAEACRQLKEAGLGVWVNEASRPGIEALARAVGLKIEDLPD
ncbi:MAG: hypothetical protein AB1801_14220 [Chloroflexota bacterium]